MHIQIKHDYIHVKASCLGKAGWCSAFGTGGMVQQLKSAATYSAQSLLNGSDFKRASFKISITDRTNLFFYKKQT